MAIYLGSNNISPLYLGSTEIGKAYLGSVQVYGPSQPFLPAHTIRCKFSTGYKPRMGDSNTLVDADENIWDIYVSSNNWSWLFYIDLTSMSYQNPYLLKVIAANTTGVTSMWCMFEGCINLTSVPWMDTSSVTSMGLMFCRCPKLTTIPLLDTRLVTNMEDMFAGCTKLKTVPLLDTSAVTDLSGMFDGCTNLTAIPLLDTRLVIDMTVMFRGCTNLTTIPLLDTHLVTHMGHMFDGCYIVESGALALYRQASTQANPPTHHADTFKNCGRDTVTGAAELSQIPSDWGGTKT